MRAEVCVNNNDERRREKEYVYTRFKIRDYSRSDSKLYIRGKKEIVKTDGYKYKFENVGNAVTSARNVVYLFIYQGASWRLRVQGLARELGGGMGGRKDHEVGVRHRSTL